MKNPRFLKYKIGIERYFGKSDTKKIDFVSKSEIIFQEFSRKFSHFPEAKCSGHPNINLSGFFKCL